jgi:hypothetical protein
MEIYTNLVYDDLILCLENISDDIYEIEEHKQTLPDFI